MPGSRATGTASERTARASPSRWCCSSAACSSPSRFGLVALIATGYRALAYILLAIFILPLVTVGIWKLVQAPATNPCRQPSAIKE